LWNALDNFAINAKSHSLRRDATRITSTWPTYFKTVDQLRQALAPESTAPIANNFFHEEEKLRYEDLYREWIALDQTAWNPRT
jgi:hypothetical protein